jgi:Leucine-rich repeat (LRR) protein/serine/threonine protein phosphatase PrpC
MAQVELEPVGSDFYDGLQLSAIEIRYRSVTSIEVREELVAKVEKIRLLGCRLTEIPVGLLSYTNITLLDLTENNLEVIAETEFLSFPFLDTLDLTGNRIRRLSLQLPEKLKTLQVSYNPDFEIESIWQIAAPSLQTLSATHCGISQLPTELPSWASTLRTLNLDGNSLEAIPPILAQFPALDELSLFANLITEVRPPFPGTLKQLNLGFNCIARLEDTTGFSVQAMNLGSNFFVSFPANVWSIDSLRSVSVSRCSLSGVLDFEVPPSIVGFDVSFNQITGLSETLVSSLQHIVALNMVSNQIKSLPDCFPANHQIVRFFGDNNLLEDLPASLLTASQLETFTVPFNCLQHLREFNFPRIRSLNLSFNCLREISDSFRPSSVLADLNVSFNKLTALPPSLGCCRKLLTLVAAGNEFERLPQCILSFSQLKTLILSGNHLRSLPSGVGFLLFLKTLDLSNNNFVEIPDFLAQLKSLKSLSLAHNSISAIPAGFQFTQNLSLLDLSFNKIREISLDLPQTPSVSLDYNLLTSFDPSRLAACHFLALNCNRLTEVPAGLDSLTNLRCVELLGNECGPSDITNSKIHILDAARASFPVRFGVGYAGTLGDRQTMEDAVAFANVSESAFFCGVFDGHSGHIAAITAADYMTQRASEFVDVPALPDHIRTVFIELNEELRSRNVSDGCTAATLFAKDETAFVAAIGDSRAVKVSAFSETRLTIDAKTTIRSEYERLRAAGLTINTDGRIGRKLGVARSLGDFSIGPGVFVPPDVVSFPITDEDDSIIIACDGLWDVVSDAVAATVVRKAVTAADAAVALKNFAIALGSKDNVSVIVVKLHPGEGDGGLCARNSVETLPPIEEEGPPTPSPGQLPQRRRR